MSWILEHAWSAAPFAFAYVGFALWWNRTRAALLPFDAPDDGRKRHGARVPLAGIALVPIVGAGCMAAGKIEAGWAALACGALGYVDDWTKEQRRDLDWKIKAAVLGTACCALAATHASPIADPLQFSWLLALAFLLVNATNFLDNTNGVAATLCATCLLCSGGANGPFAPVAFTALGFLPWNWPRARAFLGDAGAYALGIAVAAAALHSLDGPTGLWPFAILLFDFVQVVTVRVALGKKPWVGDRRHVTHWLLNLGAPAWAVAPLLALAAAALAAFTR